MEVSAKILKEFVKKASLNGDITTINLDFNEEGLQSSVQCISNIAMTFTALDKSVFKDYEAIGRILIKDSKMLLTYLDTFDSDVMISRVDEYILKLFDMHRAISVILGSDLICTNIVDKEPDLSTNTEEIALVKDDLAKSIKDMTTLKMNKLTFNREGEYLTLEVGVKDESDFLINSVSVPDGKNVKSSIGSNIINLFSALGDNFKIKLGTDLPIGFEETTENITFRCYIAPINNDR